MFTVIETHAFIRYSAAIWIDDAGADFVNWIAANPMAGDVIPGAGGLRKVRWSRPGMGKRGGARVITYALNDAGEVWLLIVYTKSKFDNLPVSFLNALKQEVDHG